jgi:hypothetical protein
MEKRERIAFAVFLSVLLMSGFFVFFGEYTPVAKSVFIFRDIGGEFFSPEDCVYEFSEGLDTVYLRKPYNESVLCGFGDFSEGSAYSWELNGEGVDSGSSEQLFLAHFDNSLTAENGETPTDQSDFNGYATGKFSSGIDGRVIYSGTNNFDLDEGSMEIWATPKGTVSGDYDFFQYDDSKYTFEMKFKPGIEGFQFKLIDDSSGDAESNMHIYKEEVEPGTQSHFVLTWSKANDIAYLYKDGQKKSSDEYDFTSEGSSPTIIIGHSQVIVDEVRIYSRPLTEKEVEYIYYRNKPLEDNEVYYSSEMDETDEIEFTLGGASISQEINPKKIKVNSPKHNVVSNRDELVVSFTTPNAMDACKYDLEPKDYDDLENSITQVTSTTYEFSIDSSSIIDSKDFYIKCKDQCEDDYSFYKRVRVLPEINNNFPKLANVWWNGGVDEEDIQNLSMYDYLCISPGNLAGEIANLREIREINPNILITVYDAPWEVGGKQIRKYFFSWDKHFLMDDSWRLRDAEGNYVNNLYYPFSENYNIRIENAEYHEISMNHVVNAFLETGHFDGMFYDNMRASFWWLNDRSGPDYYPNPLDIDEDGVNEDLDNQADFYQDAIIFGEGLSRLMQLSEETLGEETLVMVNAANDSADKSNGKMWEEKLSESRFNWDLTDPTNTNSYHYWNDNAREPIINLNLVNIDPENVEKWDDYEHSRYGLGVSLLYDLYFYPVINDAKRNTFWMDEYSVDLVSGEPSYSFDAKGYLGEPSGEIVQVDGDDQVFRKRFDNGIVIISNIISRGDYGLGKYYREISGIQDPEANGGGLVNTVNLNRTDGRILLLPLCSNNPNNDADCISTDDGSGGDGDGGSDGGPGGGGTPGGNESGDGQNSTGGEEVGQEGGIEYPAIIGELFERGNSTITILITILVSIALSVYFSLVILKKKKSFKSK